MKLFKSMLGLAAIAATIPYKVIAEETEKGKVCSLTSLTWKADYKADKETKETTLSIDLLGGLQEAVDKTVEFVRETFFTDEATEDFCEVVEIPVEETDGEETVAESEEAVEIVETVEVEEMIASPAQEEIIETTVTEIPVEAAPAKDARFDEAVQVAIEAGKISTSMLQKKLSIGYSRASKIINAMEAEGLIGPSDGKNAREVLVDKA